MAATAGRALAGGAWAGTSANGLALFDDSRSRERLRRIMEDGTPPNTKRAYSSDIRYFWEWMASMGLGDHARLPVPVEVVARFVVDHVEGLDPETLEALSAAGSRIRKDRHSVSTVTRRLAALSSLHRAKRVENPCADPMVTELMTKARRGAARRGERPNKKRAAVRETLDRMLATCGNAALGDVRDRALLLFGWASGGRRRSEIAAAAFESLEAVGDGYLYHLGITKGDQEGVGAAVPVLGDAADALRRWIEDAGISEGPIFRAVDRHGNVAAGGITDQTIAAVVKKRAALAGLPAGAFAGHSLRSGFITEAGLRGHGLLDAMALSRHKTVQVAAGYHQAGSALHNKTARMPGRE